MSLCVNEIFDKNKNEVEFNVNDSVIVMQKKKLTLIRNGFKKVKKRKLTMGFNSCKL